MGGLLSNPRWLAGAAAGLAAAVLSLWAMRGLPLGFAAFWLTPLPLFGAGLGFGPGAMAAAASLAAAIHLAVAGFLPTVVFLVAFAVPALLLVSLGFRQGRIDPGLPLAVLGIWPAVVIIGSAVAFSGTPGGLEGAMRQAITQGLARMGTAPGQMPVDELAQVMAAALGFWSAVSLSVNGAAAQSALARSGLALAPTPRWSEVRLPGWYPALPGAGAAFWLAFGGEGNVVALSVLLVLLLPVFLQGIAAVHRRSAGRPGRGFMLGAFYAGLVILSVPAAIAVTAFGFYEQWGRRTSPPGGTT
ncbi:DUF2232 domain-containing protein [Roseomonas alkaliterrae]|uniref:DUF2232 domain-containing protein n=1 Tax=Neoroseomonas alkaliterrae TaxID=1452450 RepID=A0A840XL07_9PROT|nr:DUF2232 domain-containing protein [Neoroseomonas alkaliterrae]MBB5689295.1 hypothetical protein [Neoroseomonas alkaliterrae]MBR0677532.1 DUF2232 domain-containing protein [Neoroseomonas alkaliterrae]